MYQKILVAYNASAHSAIALEEAADIARASGGELHVLGIVVNTGALAIADTAAASGSVLTIEHERIKEALDLVCSQLKDQGLNATGSVREGDAAQQIVATAYQIGADLAVIGHSNKGLLTRWFQGSVGARLMTELPCSLLVAADTRRA